MVNVKLQNSDKVEGTKCFGFFLVVFNSSDASAAPAGQFVFCPSTPEMLRCEIIKAGGALRAFLGRAGLTLLEERVGFDICPLYIARMEGVWFVPAKITLLFFMSI